MREATTYILGLDLGSNSLGWAAVRAREDRLGKLIPEGLLDLGVRVFDSGSDGDLDKGREVSKNSARRDARLLRRQHERRARRMDFIHLCLQMAGLLPSLPPEQQPEWRGMHLWRKRSGADRAERARLRHDMLNELDQELLAACREWNGARPAVTDRALPQRVPYFLRAAALDRELPPFAVGRALLHLAQRRGYLSNRKTERDEDEELGKVEGGIETLRQHMAAEGRRTLGELFLHRPEEERIRGKWTARSMYEDEFAAIWEAQATWNPGVFTPEWRDKLRRAIFRQRPLKSAQGLIGECEWEKGRQRAPLALLAAQRFRALQQLNHARLILADEDAARPLTDAERETLFAELDLHGDMTFAQAKKLLGLKANKAKFNFESGGEKRLLGNRTAAKLAKVFGVERWRDMDEEERNAVVEDWRRTERDETLYRHGRELWGLDEETARRFSRVALEDGYCGLSRQALEKIMPHLVKGMSYMEACQAVYGDVARKNKTSQALLPPVEQVLPSLRNPTVERILTELRKVMNALMRKWGRPAAIRVEMARELRKSRKTRERIWKTMRGREDERVAAQKSILSETGNANPSRADIEKMLLYKECKGQCPYTGEQISVKQLFDGSVEVEHIIPFSVSLDNSFLNKTLCVREANRDKGNRTPWEAFGHDERRWHEMTLRLRQFPGGTANEKVRRFLAKEHPELDDFASRQLNDASYAAKEALGYLGLLYGEGESGRVQAGRGGLTGFFRDEWGVNRLLGDGDRKNRDDHRHHAVDALVIALIDRAAMQRLSEAAVRALSERRRRFGRLESPWPGFLDEAGKRLAGIVVSRRVSRKVSGPLHEETYYGPGPDGDGVGKECRHLRCPVHMLKEKDFADIVDPVVRKAVTDAFRKLPKADAKLFEQDEHRPYLTAKDGRRIPIRKVRLASKNTVLTIGKAAERRRYAIGGNNHHAEILAVLDGDGKATGMEWVVVSMFEAYERKKNHASVIQRDHGPLRKFLYSLSAGENVELKAPDGERRIYVCRGVTIGELTFTEHLDARKQADLKAAKAQIRIRSKKSLVDQEVRKVVVTPLGEIREAHD